RAERVPGAGARPLPGPPGPPAHTWPPAPGPASEADRAERRRAPAAGRWTAPVRSALSSPSGNRDTRAGAEGRAGVRSIILHAPVLLFVPATTVADPTSHGFDRIGFRKSIGDLLGE